jgi:hypothetical protein
LHVALKTYLDTDIGFRYAAFVGSFSSGKTATINNLLRLSREERRAEDINPVDERLTVCVHEQRKDSVLAALLKSSWDADKFFHQADDLSDIILVDTPGGGDPKIRTDIVYNFLPICDTIVYCFNATNPLNTNDLPILRELNDVLQHTDFFYVYTRADNVFRIDESEALTPENFDQERAHRQRDTFASRLGQLLGTAPARAPELLFVSNATGHFGIDDLRQRLLTPPGDATTLSLKKIAFFRGRSANAINKILKMLQELRVTVGELVSRAEQNHQLYNQKFEIRTEEIKEFWRNAQDILRRTLGHFKELKTNNVHEPISIGALETKALREINSYEQIEEFTKRILI